jgi:hypothetical protein
MTQDRLKSNNTQSEQYEVTKSDETICYLTSQELEQIIKSKGAVIINE